MTAVHLLDLEGLPVPELDSGDPLRVEIEYLAPQPICAPIFGVTITRKDGLVCYDTNTAATVQTFVKHLCLSDFVECLSSQEVFAESLSSKWKPQSMRNLHLLLKRIWLTLLAARFLVTAEK